MAALPHKNVLLAIEPHVVSFIQKHETGQNEV
jgi:hypothetical protein